MEEPLLDIQSTPRKRRVTTWILVLIIIGLTVGLIVVAVQKHNSNGGADNYQYSLDANTTQRILSFLDQSADPCQDFYQYACGNFHHAAPAGGQYAYSFNSIGEMVQAEQLQILTANFPMISDFFNGCMDVDTIESRNITDLRKWLSQIDAATSPVDIINIVGSLQHMSMATSALFIAQIQSDYHYADKYHLYVMPGGTTFSDPDQYQTSDLRGQMFAYFVQLFSYDMDPYPATKLALQAAKDVWALEYTIANFSHFYDGSDTDRAYVISRTRMMPNSTIFSEITGMNWNSYFTALQASPHPASDVIAVVDGSRGNCPSPVNPCPDSFFFKLGQLLQITPMPILKNYLKWHSFLGISRYLPKYFRDIGDELVDDYGVQAFHANIRANLKASKHRQQFCQAETVTQFANYLSHEWIVSDLPQGTIPAVGQLVDLIYQQIGNRLNTVEWLQNDNVTRTAAHHKWEEIAKNVGPTSGWYSYSHLYMTGNPLIDRATIQTYYLQQTSKLYETYVNRSQTTPNQDWTIQNAYYDPTTNSINLIPGLMFPPFYSPKVPQFLNLATYGMVIGHEITHGFDNSGRLYNGTGAFVNWWTNQTAQEFDRRATCLVNQYSGYKVVNQTYINGKQTLGENIADNGGIRAAWNAYKYTTANNQPGPAMAQFNNDQLFFVYYAQSWCVNATAAGLERQVKNDVHSPAKWRVNGPLSNLPYFAQSYGCRADQPMGRSLDDSKRCEVW